MNNDHIPQLPDDHNNAVDWKRVKRSARLRQPVRAVLTLGAGIAAAPWWATNLAQPLARRHGPDVAYGLVALTAISVSIALSNQRLRPIVRTAVASVLVAAVTGTVYTVPILDAITHWTSEN